MIIRKRQKKPEEERNTIYICFGWERPNIWNHQFGTDKFRANVNFGTSQQLIGVDWLKKKLKSQNFAKIWTSESCVEIKSSKIAFLIWPITVNQPQDTGFTYVPHSISNCTRMRFPRQINNWSFFVKMIYLFGHQCYAAESEHSSYVQCSAGMCIMVSWQHSIYNSERVSITIVVNVQLNSKHIDHSDVLIIAN